MKYLKVDNGGVEYPYTIEKLRKDNPNVSFPSTIPDQLLAKFGVYAVLPVSRPSSTLTQNPVEQTPELINGQWTQVWAMVDVSPEEAARRQQAATDDAKLQATKADAFVRSFIAMTPAQVEAYVTNNTGSLAQMRALVTKMALMMLTLARREYR